MVVLWCVVGIFFMGWAVIKEWECAGGVFEMKGLYMDLQVRCLGRHVITMDEDVIHAGTGKGTAVIVRGITVPHSI